MDILEECRVDNDKTFTTITKVYSTGTESIGTNNIPLIMNEDKIAAGVINMVLKASEEDDVVTYILITDY